MMKRTLPATFEAISHFTAELESWVNALAPQQSTPIALAAQELMTNIVRHAYAGQHGDIHFELQDKQGQLIMIIRDHAPNRYIPPAAIELPDPLEIPVGGWGMYLIYELMDQVEYEALPGVNQWQLTKYYGGSHDHNSGGR